MNVNTCNEIGRLLYYNFCMDRCTEWKKNRGSSRSLYLFVQYSFPCSVIGYYGNVFIKFCAHNLNPGLKTHKNHYISHFGFNYSVSRKMTRMNRDDMYVLNTCRFNNLAFTDFESKYLIVQLVGVKCFTWGVLFLGETQEIQKGTHG